MSVLLEYIWLDGYETPNLRSKIKVVQDWDGDPPVWNFDGSSTQQAPGNNSECLLNPVRVYSRDKSHYFIFCEVLNADGSSHVTNARAKLRSLKNNFCAKEFWWGFEQEYFITNKSIPLGFPEDGYPEPQGIYYCGVGGDQVRGRNLALFHLCFCLDIGIELTGINAEVAIGQWEYQCFAKDTLKACDDLWMSRYLLYKLTEEKSWNINISPKPVKGDWNGSGCHTNFSTKLMRETGGKERFEKILNALQNAHADHIASYGAGNENRLTGLHETQRIDTFSWGVADRGASIRVPSSVEQNEWRGYLEDRRPASNCDPYKVAEKIVSTLRET